ncbi:Cellulose synthase-like protein D2 [Linum perenne]
MANPNSDPYHARRPSTLAVHHNYRDYDSSEIGNSSIESATTYTVHIPPTPDTHRRPMINIDTSSTSLSVMARPGPVGPGENRSDGSGSGLCQVRGCDARAMEDDPCRCGYRVCGECFKDAVEEGGECFGCKVAYEKESLGRLDRTLTVVDGNGRVESEFDSVEDGGVVDLGGEKERKALTRTVGIPGAIIGSYRLFIVIRIIAIVMFLQWRITNPNDEAIWLWGMSVICELWFSFTWILDQLPKLRPVKRTVDLDLLKEKFESPYSAGKSDLPGIDVIVSTSSDPPPLVTANTVLSVLAADYPVEKLSCYVSDDGGSLLTFEAMAEAASFARVWVPFCKKHGIEPRNPDAYFGLKRDPYKDKVRPDFVRDRRRVKREYDEFKVCINGLPDSIRRRSDAYNTHEEIKAMKKIKESGDDDEAFERVMLQPPTTDDPIHRSEPDDDSPNPTESDLRLPTLIYVSREKRAGYDHNKKAGEMNAIVRVSAVMSNGPFVLNLDSDHYVHNSQSLREGICFMIDGGGEDICFVQYPHRYEGVDPSDRYANRNSVFFDVNMRALDGIQGPVYVGTGCLFRRTAVYGFDPPEKRKNSSAAMAVSPVFESGSGQLSRSSTEMDSMEYDVVSMNVALIPKKFGNSSLFVDSIRVAAYQGLPLADHPSVNNGRARGALTGQREVLSSSTIGEAMNVISSWYEDKTEWGGKVGWMYGSITEDVVTGYRMHERGWRSVYCVTRPDAFRGIATINLTDRLHEVLRLATGSVEILFSRNNALLAGRKLKFLQRVAYLNVGIRPFSSIFLLVYCFLPALSLFTDKLIVPSLGVDFLIYLLIVTVTLAILAVLEIKWSGVALEEWWRDEQFWVIGGTSAHLAAVVQGLLKSIIGVEMSLNHTSKPSAKLKRDIDNDKSDEFAEMYLIKWTSLMIPPCTIIIVNIVGIAIGFSRTISSDTSRWENFTGSALFSLWVLVHLYPFAKGLMGKRGKTPTIVFVWSGLISICISLLWVALNPAPAKSRIG